MAEHVRSKITLTAVWVRVLGWSEAETDSNLSKKKSYRKYRGHLQNKPAQENRAQLPPVSLYTEELKGVYFF